MTKAELKGLTGLRGVAAWFVVLYHIRKAIAPSISPVTMAIFAKGYLAVDLFFILSGFVMWLNYAERLHADGVAAAPQFLVRRIARIWPLHLVMLGFAAALVLALNATGRYPSGFPWHELPLHMLLLQNWGFTSTLTWNDPAWSISCELGAYLLFPILCGLVVWERYRTAALLASGASLLGALWAFFAAHGATLLGADILHYGLVRCLLEFATGTIVCALWKRWRSAPAAAPLALGLAVCALLGWWTGVAPETALVPIAFASLLLGLALAERTNPLRLAPFHYLGEISYATYLAHYLLFFAFKLAFVRDAHAMPPWQAGVFLALTFAASVALHHGVERPAQRAINRLAKRTRQPKRQIVRA